MSRTDDKFVNSLIYEYLLEDAKDKSHYYDTALKNSDAEFEAFKTNRLKLDFIELEANKFRNNPDCVELNCTEIYEIQKLCALNEYFFDYTQKVDEKKKDWFVKQSQIIQKLLSCNIPGRFGIIEDCLYKKTQFITKKGGLGRLYANNVSMQYLSKETRSFLFSKKYKDFDLVNSQFSILANYARKNSLDVPALFSYVGDRESILKEKMEKDSIDRETAKKRLFITLNSRESYGKQQGFFSAFLVVETKKLRMHLFENFLLKSKNMTTQYFNRPEMIDLLKKNDLEQNQIKFQALYSQTQETNILFDFYMFLTETMVKDANDQHDHVNYLNSFKNKTDQITISFVPFFDGAYIKTDSDILNHRLSTYVEDFNKLQHNKDSYIQFAEKPIEITYENINIDILEKYLAIRLLLLKCTSKRLNQLFIKFNVKPFELPKNSKVTPTNSSEFCSYAAFYREKFYSKLLGYSVNEIESFEQEE